VTRDPLRVLIVGRDASWRARLRSIAGGAPGAAVVGERDLDRSTTAAVRDAAPDLVVVHDASPAPATRASAASEVAGELARAGQLVAYVSERDRDAAALYASGVFGYVLTSTVDQQLPSVLTRAMARRGVEREAREGRLLLERLHPLVELARHGATMRPAPGAGATQRLLLRHRGKAFAVDSDEVEWAEARGNDVTLHLRGRTVQIRLTMKKLESALGDARFARIHRAVLVNLDRVDRLEPGPSGGTTLVLTSGRQLSVSRTYRASLLRRLGVEQGRPSADATADPGGE
jgi:two-component system LytT family response regulator